MFKWFVLLLFAAVIALFLLMDRYSFTFVSTPLGVQVKFHCNDDILNEWNLKLADMPNVEGALRKNQRHIDKADFYVDRARSGSHSAKDHGYYYVELVLNNGCTILSKPKTVHWTKLDSNISTSISNCMREYYHLRDRHDLKLGPNTVIEL
ncbi:MAG: hypothetical protein AB7D51_12430 [Desulfovibrionaceae bacterium]